MDIFNFDPKELAALQKSWKKDEMELYDLDEVEFRARFRERCHHTMEIQIYEAIHQKKSISNDQTKTAEMYLRVWDKRGLSHTEPEYRYVQMLIGFAEQLKKGEIPDLSGYEPKWLSKEETKVFERVLYERRSVRHWDLERRVPDEILEKIVKAGLWGAHACNLQSLRFLVIREEDSPGLFRGSDIPGGPVHIVLLQDMRTYKANPFMPGYNTVLDCGAAGQNVVLAAHAYGLGGTWLTFTSKQMIDRIREKYNVPEEIRILTYVDVGYPAQFPCPPLRAEAQEAILNW